MNKMVLILAVALLVTNRACAGEPAPEKPPPPVVVQPGTWRPFKEMQDVLYYESFEHPMSACEKGKIVSEEPVPPGGHAWKLETAAAESMMQFHVAHTQMKIPQGLPPAQIFIQAAIYVDEPGSITIKATHGKGEYSRDVAIPHVKAWGFIQIKLSDMRGGKGQPAPEPDQTIREIEIHVKGPAKATKKEAPKAWIDDILITLGSNPADVRPRVMAAEKKRLDMEKQLERDGFTYTMGVNDYLKAGMKAFKRSTKPKHVMVFGPNPEQTQAWVKQLAIAAPKLKDTTYVFEAAEEPAGSPTAIGGMADMRSLLLYNLQKDPEFALLVVGPEDAGGPGRPSEFLRVAAERAIDAGTIPIICVMGPSKLDEKEKIANFMKTMEAVCFQIYTPLVDGGKVSRGAKGEFDAAKAGAGGFEGTVMLAMSAIKHTHDSMAKE